MQRDACGEPLSGGAFEVLIYANNCTDDTAAIAYEFSRHVAQRVHVVAEDLGPQVAHAGHARKRAMDLAAQHVAERIGRSGERGLILTTDADSVVAPDWLHANLVEFAAGVDCVAGYVDAIPIELIRLGPAFLQRSRLEDRYLRLVTEVYARLDPRPHDPFPNHRVSSGATLAVTLDAYRAIGGLPPVPTGEDAALTRALELSGFKVRHSMKVCVQTSCRFDGRAIGGAADTMRLRHELPDAPCDDEMEPADHVVRRATIKGDLRHLAEAGLLEQDANWVSYLELQAREAIELRTTYSAHGFERFWLELNQASAPLKARTPVRPADLPAESARLRAWLDELLANEAQLMETSIGPLGVPVIRPVLGREPLQATDLLQMPAAQSYGTGAEGSAQSEPVA